MKDYKYLGHTFKLKRVDEDILERLGIWSTPYSLAGVCEICNCWVLGNTKKEFIYNCKHYMVQETCEEIIMNKVLG